MPAIDEIPNSHSRRAIVVAGMHRTGTSAITRVLGLLGADLPRTLGAPAPDNEPGFWEPIEIVRTNDQLLRELGSGWDDVSPLSQEAFSTEAARRHERRLIELLDANFGGSSLFVLKDPRICRLMPLWLSVLERFGAVPLFVIPLRNPLEVSASLRRRDGFSGQKSQLLWLRHVLEAERFSRGQRRTFVSYDRLLFDWMPVVEGIGQELGLSWSVNHETRVEIDRFLSTEFRHHTNSSEQLEEDPTILPAVKRCHALLLAAAAGPDASRVDREKLMLDGMYHEIGTADRLYGPLLAEARLMGSEREQQAVGRAAENERRAAESERQLQRRLEAANRGAGEAQRQLQRRLEAANRGAGEAQRQLQRRLEAANRGAREVQRQLADAEQRARHNERQLHERVERLERELLDRERTIAAGGAQIASLAKSASLLEDQLARSEQAARDGEERLHSARGVELDLRDELALRAASAELAEERLHTLGARIDRLRAELTEADIRQATDRQLLEREMAKLTARLEAQDTQLAQQSNQLRVAETNLRAARAQLQAKAKRRPRRGGAAAARRAPRGPFLSLRSWSRRTAKVSGWMLRAKTRPLARAYLALRKSDAFDAEYYLANYRDVARSGMHPLLHYVEYGVRDRYNPSREFSTETYLTAHPELLETAENPLLHALRAGVLEPRALPAAAEEPSLATTPAAADTTEAEHPAPVQAPVTALSGERRASEGAEAAKLDSLTAIPRGAAVLLCGSEDGGLERQLAPHRVWRTKLQRTEIESLRAKGAVYLVLDAQAQAALEQDSDLRKHLDSKYRRIADSTEFVVYELTGHRRKARKRDTHRLPGWSGIDVICMPIIDWNYRFQRPQQLMTQLARRGHRVFYVATTFQQDRTRPIITEHAPNVWGVRLPGTPTVNIYTDLASGDVVARATQGLDELRREAGIDKAFTVVDLPFWGPIAIEARNRWGWKLIYDCMDEHGGFLETDETEGRELINRQERSLLSASDLVLATSRMLHEKVRKVTGDVALVPNAADFDHFSRAGAGPLPPSTSRPIVGYYGAISSWFDSQMVADAARARPDWSFVLAGRTTGADLEPFDGLENIHLLGELPYETVPALLHQFDVATIPFHLIDLTLATNPVKFYEYMSAGKPVVSVKLPELAPYEDYFYPASSAEELVAQVERALEEDRPDLRQKRVELGRENTWSARYATIEAAISPWYPKAAIVITSFNNPEYLRMCLESLREKTDYPNYEVIVVDNGSDQTLLDEVASRSEHDQNLRLIANNENVGFARANNIGIEAASDAEYIVLLNDDTVVTHGWLGKLIGHLQDRNIGLVGPVSNWAGNEARIDVPYGDDLAGLDDFARRRTEEHRGELLDIPVLAMYCVAIRKELIDGLGGLDERFTIGMFEDDDFAMRVREAGLRVVCAEDVFIHHWGRASFKRMSDEEYRQVFEEHKRVYEKIWDRPWVPHRSRAS